MNPRGFIPVALAIMGWLALPAAGQTADTEERLNRLEQRLEDQQAELEQLRREQQEHKSDEGAFEAGWRNGFYLQTADEEFQLRPRVLIQADGQLAEANHPFENTLLVRRARLALTGKLYQYFHFKIEADFGSGRARLTDGWLDVRFLPELRVRAGQFKEPLGYEQNTGAPYLVTIERSIIDAALVPGRDAGVMLHGVVAEGVLEYALGVFNGGGSNARDTNDDKDVALYLASRPFAGSEEAWLTGLHLGVAFTWGQQDEEVGGDGLPTALGSNILELAPDVEQDGVRYRLAGELAYHVGPFGLVGEVIHSDREGFDLAGTEEDIAALGWQVTLRFMLTGEEVRRGRIKVEDPFNPFADEVGFGAWEVAFQVAQLALDDDLIDAGLASGTDRATVFTFGLNGYLNDFVKVQLNYLRADFADAIDVGGGTMRENEDAFLVRFQIAF